MTLAGFGAGQLAVIMAGGAAVITAFYLLKMRRRSIDVPFAALWQRVSRVSDARRIWRRLRRLLSWLVQLLILAAIVLALGDPRPDVWLREPATVAIVIDHSASMGGPRDGSPESEQSAGTRLDAAIARARAEIDALGPSDRALVIAAGPEVRVLSPLGRDHSALLRGLDGLHATPGEADLGRALALARNAVDGQAGPRVLLLSDGAVDDAGAKAVQECSSGPLPCSVARFTGPTSNLAITAFAARRYPQNPQKIEVLAEVVNLGDERASVILEVQADNLGIGRREMTLEPGESSREILSELDAARSRLEARLIAPPGSDVGHLGPSDDDLAFAVIPPLRALEVALATDGTNLFLEAALLTLDDHVHLRGVAIADANAQHPVIADADVVFYDPGDNPLPSTLPEKNLVLFDPWRFENSPSPIAKVRDVRRPFLTEQKKEHPILEHVVVKDVNIGRGTILESVPGDEILLRSLGEPIAVLRQGSEASVVAFGFDPRQSDLPLRTAFPVLISNLIDYFERATPGFVAAIPVGARRPIAIAELGLTGSDVTRVEIRGPEPGMTTVAPVQEGLIRVRATTPGILHLRALDGQNTGAEVALAINQASAAASDLHDRLGELPAATNAEASPTPAPLSQGPLWTLLVLIATGIIALEWASYHRRWTV